MISDVRPITRRHCVPTANGCCCDVFTLLCGRTMENDSVVLHPTNCFNHRPTARKNAPTLDHHFFLKAINDLIVLIHCIGYTVEFGFNPCQCCDDLVQFFHFAMNLAIVASFQVDAVNCLPLKKTLMKNVIFSAFVLLLFALSSCGETLEVVDWVDRVQNECRISNTTGEICMAVKCTVKVREGEISAVYPWNFEYDEWYEGECKEVFRCVKEYLVGKKVKDRSGEYEHSFIIMHPSPHH